MADVGRAEEFVVDLLSDDQEGLASRGIRGVVVYTTHQGLTSQGALDSYVEDRRGGSEGAETGIEIGQYDVREAVNLARSREALLDLVVGEELNDEGIRDLKVEVLGAGNEGQLRTDVVRVRNRVRGVVEEVVDTRDVRATVLLLAKHQSVVAVVRALDRLDADRVVAGQIESAAVLRSN